MAKTKKQPTEIEVRRAPADLARPMEPWEEELAAQAREEVAKEVLGTPRISHKGGILRIDGKPVEGNKLRCAIIDYAFSKAYYAGDYDDATPQTPVCYAFGREEKGMVPHDQSPDKQHADCAGCEWNRFGTAERGKGKRCKDERRVMCIVEVDDEESIAQAEVRQFNIPPGSLKNWGKYLNQIKEVTASGNVRAVLTEVSTEPHGGAYALTFKAIERLSKEQVMAVMGKKASVEAGLFAPYPTIEQEEQPKPKSGKKAKY